jgi:hypothetical protein
MRPAPIAGALGPGTPGHVTNGVLLNATAPLAGSTSNCQMSGVAAAASLA